MSAIIKHNYIKDRKVIYLMKKVEQLQKMIDNAKDIVVLSGAGTSTDSGLKDFRSQNGLYHMKASFFPEEMLNSKMFYQHPEKFYAFYRENLNSLNAEPNSTHLYLKKLEDEGKLKAIKKFMKFMEQFIKIIVLYVMNSIVLKKYLKKKAFQNVRNVVVLSNQMLCYMVKCFLLVLKKHNTLLLKQTYSL